MLTTILRTVIFLCTLCATAFAQDITGFWKILRDDSQQTDCIIAMYEHDGKFYGRIISTYDRQGVLEDTIYDPKSRAPGLVGNPYYCGLDIIWGLRSESDEDRYKGKIFDPKKGKVYTAEVWRSGADLIVRGEVWIFGENLVWPPATESDFPKGFKKPDLKTLVPVKPEVK